MLRDRARQIQKNRIPSFTGVPFTPLLCLWLLAVLLAPGGAFPQAAGLLDDFVVSGPECAVNVAVSAAPDGRFVVVWDDGAGQAIRGRRYDVDGSPLGGVQTLVSGSSISWPDVAMLPDHTFVLTWAGPMNTRLFRRFDALGNPAGSETTLTGLGAFLTTSRVEVARDGTAAFVWVDTVSGQDRVTTALYNSVDQPVGGGNLTVNAPGTTRIGMPAVDIEPDGDRFLVTWTENTGGNLDVKLRRWDDTTTAVGSEIVVNASTALNQLRPSVATDAEGDFVVAWQGQLPTSPTSDAVESAFLADGTRLPEARLGSDQVSESRTRVVLSNDGGTRAAVFLQEFSNQLGREYIQLSAKDSLNLNVGGSFPEPIVYDLTMDDRERLALAWIDHSVGGCGQVQAKTLQVHQNLFGPQETPGEVYSLAGQEAWKYFVYFPQAPPALVDIQMVLPTVGPQDADLFVDFARFPDLNRFLCRSNAAGGISERCTVYTDGLPVLVGVNGWEAGAIDFVLFTSEESVLFYDGFESGGVGAWSSSVGAP